MGAQRRSLAFLQYALSLCLCLVSTRLASPVRLQCSLDPCAPSCSSSYLCTSDSAISDQYLPRLLLASSSPRPSIFIRLLLTLLFLPPSPTIDLVHPCGHSSLAILLIPSHPAHHARSISIDISFVRIPASLDSISQIPTARLPHPANQLSCCALSSSAPLCTHCSEAAHLPANSRRLPRSPEAPHPRLRRRSRLAYKGIVDPFVSLRDPFIRPRSFA